MLPRLFGDRCLSLLGDLSLFLCLLGLRSHCLSILLFSLWVEELPLLDVTTLGFFEMENIKSFVCTPSPAMNAVIANFSSGTSTL